MVNWIRRIKIKTYKISIFFCGTEHCHSIQALAAAGWAPLHHSCTCGRSTCTGSSHIQRKSWQHSKQVCWVARQLRQFCRRCLGRSEQGKELGQSVASRAQPSRSHLAHQQLPPAVVLHLLCTPLLLTGYTIHELWLGKPNQEFSSIKLRVCPECFGHARAVVVPSRVSVSAGITPSTPSWDLQHPSALLRESPGTKPCNKTARKTNSYCGQT